MQFALAVALIAQAGADDTLREMMRLKMMKSMMERQFQDRNDPIVCDQLKDRPASSLGGARACPMCE